MGGALGVQIDFTGAKADDKDLEEKDNRKRNSIAFYISSFVEFEEDNFGPLIEVVMRDKNAKTGGKPPTIRNSKFSKTADSILGGNLKELRNQVVVYFKTINRHYADHHMNNTLMHMICQEGYFPMLSFMANPLNRSDLDHNDLEIEPRNNRNRTPLMLCFTPPSATHCGMAFGVGPDGNALSEKPADVESLSDWCKPGGPKNRENCVRLLVEKGADVLQKDYQDFTVLHFAAMWGWTSTVRYLLEKGADVNAQTNSGRTALMYAVQYQHTALVTVLARRKDILLEQSDLEGYTALIVAVEMGEEGFKMARLLLEEGAEPNAQTLRRKTPLKIACLAQDIVQVNLLLDFKAQRRNSAFNLLTEAVLVQVNARLENDDRKQRLEEERQAKEAEKLEATGFYDPSKGMKSPLGAWVEYAEKRTGKAFYYNTVTRKSLRSRPKDYKPSKSRVVPEAIFGLSFYH
mmetsp:Transcript_19406/g.43250  ORF Transcript_19406/g.43250 Transcript_19406/m.43250 type:complete len:461 (-) Transcript_19406:111-1493(-)